MGFSLSGAGKGAATGASTGGSVGGGWGAAIGAIGGALIGGFMGNKSAKDSSAAQYAYNLKLQKQAQQWQEQMSNTAHQREKADLLAAGINPLYTATGGNGASTGSVGANNVANDNRAMAVQQAISNAINYKLLNKQIEKLDSEIDNINGSPKTIIGKIMNGKADEVERNIGKSVNSFKSSIKDIKETGKQVLKGYVEKHNEKNEDFKKRYQEWKFKKNNKFLDDKGRELYDIDNQIRQKYIK